jgi:hypothetical protein
MNYKVTVPGNDGNFGYPTTLEVMKQYQAMKPGKCITKLGTSTASRKKVMYTSQTTTNGVVAEITLLHGTSAAGLYIEEIELVSDIAIAAHATDYVVCTFDAGAVGAQAKVAEIDTATGGDNHSFVDNDPVLATSSTFATTPLTAFTLAQNEILTFEVTEPGAYAGTPIWTVIITYRDLAALDHYIPATDSWGETVIFSCTEPGGVYIEDIQLVTSAAVTSHATNGQTFTIQKRTAGVASTIAAGSTLAADLAGMAAWVPETATDFGTTALSVPVLLANGDTVTLKTTTAGTAGQALQGLTAIVHYRVKNDDMVYGPEATEFDLDGVLPAIP